MLDSCSRVACLIALALVVACSATDRPGASSLSKGVQISFTGAWTLVSDVEQHRDGHIADPYGPNPLGRIIYTDDGLMAVQLMQRNRRSFANPDHPTLEELQQNSSNFHSYYGRYSVNLADSTVTHYVEASVLPSWIGTERVRRFRFRGDTLILVTQQVPDDPLMTTLRWVRAR